MSDHCPPGCLVHKKRMTEDEALKALSKAKSKEEEDQVIADFNAKNVGSFLYRPDKLPGSDLSPIFLTNEPALSSDAGQ